MKPVPMSAFVLFAGLLGMVFQLMPDGDLLTFIVALSALTAILGIRIKLDERESQLLDRAFSMAFQWLFAALYVLFSVYVLLGWIPLLGDLRIFLEGHWLGLMASFMCVLLGIAGIRIYRDM
jgi:hypothetical protein